MEHYAEIALGDQILPDPHPGGLMQALEAEATNPLLPTTPSKATPTPK